ncbi:MAG TPA: oligosaccharide flippase family protein [Usitatibacter sp.]|nr:oligosaccharide flippase family protein [Usitatibacter sp.]
MAIESPPGEALAAVEAAIRRPPAPGARLRRVLMNSGAGLAAKAASFLVTLALFPLLIAYLGKAEFAIWLVAASLVQVLAWTDLGLGNATVTRIARRAAEPGAIGDTVASAYACVAAVTALVGGVLAILWHARAIDLLLGGALAVEARPVFAIGLAAFVAWLPTALAGSIETGLRMGGIASLCQAASAILTGALSYWAVRAGRPLADLVAIACFTPVAANLANTVALLVARPDLRPRLRRLSWAESRELLRLGGLFLALQLGVMALTGADAVILLRQAGAAQAVDYSAVAKLFGAVSILGATLFAPLWPEYGAAHARGELDWVRRTFGRSLAAALALGIAGGAILAFASPALFALWLGPGVQPSAALVFLAATWLVYDLCSQSTAMLLNGMAVVRPQIVTSLAFAAACLPLKWIVAARYGAVGIYATTLVCYTAAVALPYAFIVPGLLRSRG